MKKQFILAGLALALTLPGCKKEGFREENAVENKGVTITYKVNDDALIAKSAYTPGTGVAMTGNEPMGVFFYSAADEAWNKCEALGIATANSYKATGESSVYSYTAPEGTEAFPWYAAVPYTKGGVQLQTGNKYVTIRLSPVQNPAANSFDPQFDLLFSEPFVPTAGTAEINSFKRLFSPLCVKFTGLAAGEKIYAASIAINQTIDEGSTNSLTGIYSANFAEDYAETAHLTSQNNATGNGATALSSEGIPASGSAWPVWYMVHDMTIAAGTTLTASVSTGSATYTRTITFPAETKIEKDKLNSLTINMAATAEGVSQQESVMVPFTTVTSIAEGVNNFNASNGGKIAMQITGSGSRLWVAATQDESNMSNALNLNKRSFTIPTISDKKVIGVRIYTHAMNHYKLATDSYLTLKSGEQTIATANYNLCPTTAEPQSLYAGCGFVDFTLPETATSMSGMTVSGDQADFVSAVTFFTADDIAEYKEASENDLYTEFSNLDNKIKITINGVEYKNDVVTFYNDDPATAATTDLQKAGLHFISGAFNFNGNLKIGNAVYVSRYQDNPASIKATQIQPTGDLTFKNVSLEGTNSNNLLPNSQANDDITLSLENCYVKSPGGFIRDVNDTYCYKNIIAHKCTFNINGALYFLNTSNKKASSHNSQTLFSFTNCEITFPSVQAVILVNPGQVDAYETPGLELVFTGNALENIAGSTALMNFRGAKKITISDNNATAALTEDSQIIKLSSGTVAEASVISGNTFTSTGEGKSWSVWTNPIDNITESNNTFN